MYWACLFVSCFGTGKKVVLSICQSKITRDIHYLRQILKQDRHRAASNCCFEKYWSCVFLQLRTVACINIYVVYAEFSDCFGFKYQSNVSQMTCDDVLIVLRVCSIRIRLKTRKRNWQNRAAWLYHKLTTGELHIPLYVKWQRKFISSNIIYSLLKT